MNLILSCAYCSHLNTSLSRDDETFLCEECNKINKILIIASKLG